MTSTADVTTTTYINSDGYDTCETCGFEYHTRKAAERCDHRDPSGLYGEQEEIEAARAEAAQRVAERRTWAWGEGARV